MSKSESTPNTEVNQTTEVNQNTEASVNIMATPTSTSEKITPQNYAERTRNMPSLLPEWIPDERNLKANGMLKMYLGEEHNVVFRFDGEPQDEETIEHLLAHAWNDTKLKPGTAERENMLRVQEAIGYNFVNERFLLQAFTRRSFVNDMRKSMLSGADYEVLEVAGDALLSAAFMKVFFRQHARFLGRSDEGNLYFCDYDEGDVSRIKQKYTSRDYLSSRCADLGFDKFIRYGKDDDQSLPGPREDVMEAIVAAAAIDSDWDMEIVESVVETLLDVHLAFDPWDASRDYFDTLNSWWQKRYGCLPEYKVWKSDELDSRGRALYECDLRFSLSALDNSRDWDAWYAGDTGDAEPREDWVIPRHEREGDEIVFHSRRISKSEARSMCARSGLRFIKAAGLFMSLKDCGFVPCLDEAINQLQILSQRGYIGEVEYDFDDLDDRWDCKCSVDSFRDEVEGETKKESKKKAAFAVLIQIFRSAGIDDKAWDRVFEE